MRKETCQRSLRVLGPAAIAMIAVLGLGLAASAWAAADKPAPRHAESVRGAEPAGLSVAVDPKTGKIRQPTPEELAALNRSFEQMFGKSALTNAAQPIVWPDGTVALALSDEYLNAWVARVNPDGSLSQGCVSSPEEAAAFFAGAAPALEEK